MNTRIVGAIVFGVLLVCGAYVKTHLLTPASEPAALVVAERSNPVRGYIATKDKDGDGVEDWRAALRTTDPIKLDAIASSTYEIPDTLTDKFAIDLFTNMIESKSYGEYGRTPEELIADSKTILQSQVIDELFTEDDITVSLDESAEAARRYANQIANIALINGIPGDTENEAIILDRALKFNDPDLLADLDIIEASYAGMVVATRELPVPTNLVKQHLDLLNSYQAILNDVRAMQQAFVDPLFSLLRMQRYQDDATGLSIAFTNVFKEARDLGAVFAPGDETLSVVQFSE